MLIVAVLVASFSQLPETEISKGSPTLFGQLAELDVEKGRLVVHLKGGAQDPRDLRQRALNLFPSASRVSVHTNNGSTSTSRGGGSGTVSIRIQNRGGTQTLTYELTDGSGREKVLLEQTGEGQLKLEIQNGSTSVRLEQTPNKCSLRIKASPDRVSTSGGSLQAIFQAHPLAARKHLFGAIKRYFGNPPFMPLTSAPPGKTLVRLRDGDVIVGEVRFDAVVLVTDYGRLTIPRNELFHVFFPGAGAGVLGGEKPEGSAPTDKSLVVTRRFTPRGKLDLESLSLSTPYGDLEIAASEILHISFGPVEHDGGEPTRATSDPVTADR